MKIIVAFTPGSATDIIAHVTADQFGRSMGRSFVAAAKAKPGEIAYGSLGRDSGAKAD